jgi:hypothetical protein
MVLVAVIWGACSVFIFLFGTRDNAVLLLGAYGTICTILSGVFHWLLVRDSKIPDARSGVC